MSADKIQLKDYHLFSHGGEYYLLNIDDMTSHHIEREQYEMLGGIKNRLLDAEISGNLQVYLSLLNLIGCADGGRTLKMPESVPFCHAMVNVTQECNLNCKYCFAVGGEYGSRGYMSRETAFSSADWLIMESGDNRDLSITFFGGEPLLAFGLIKEVVAYVRAKKTDKVISFGIVTNGTLINDEVIEFLKKYEFKVGIGFDAVERLQNYYRPFRNGKESYEIVRKNISSLMASGISRINITCMVSDEKTGFKEARNALMSMGCSAMGIQRPAPPILESAEAEHVEVFSTIRSGDLTEYTERMLLSVEEEGQDWLASIRERKLIPSKLFSGITGQLLARRRREYYCGAGKGMANISISGDIYACHRFNGLDHMKMGSIDSYDAQSQKRYIENHTSRIPECSRCHARYFCGAGCLHENMAAGGGIDRPYRVECDMMKRAVETGIAIYHRLSGDDREYLKNSARLRGRLR